MIVARIISVTGSLLLVVAAIHLLVTPALKSGILDRSDNNSWDYNDGGTDISAT